MSEKIKFEQEYLFKTSPKVLNSMLMTPSGLSEWFSDDVDIKDDIYTFYWNGSEEKARLLGKKPNEYIKFQWLEDEEAGRNTFVELRFKVDPMTKAVVLNLTSFAEEDELEEVQLYWENTIGDLKRMIGA
ncbi:MAG: START-like domain-containing protein [Brumimicrobium sp.]|nr:START-like domain-containing protein [Brumimicrobium sp.]